jgi:hypothetical protein
MVERTLSVAGRLVIGAVDALRLARRSGFDWGKD